MSPHHRHDHHPNGVATQNGAHASIVSPIVPSSVPGASREASAIQKLAHANEETWLLIGSVAEGMGVLDRALSAYEHALRHNPNSIAGLTNVANIARIKEKYSQATEYFQRVLHLQPENGEVWSSVGHCYLMQDDLQKAYSAYQQALYFLPNPKEDPKLWYGIGILYDRYGSIEHAEEAFNSVLRMDKDFEKANEILFRLGIIYKQQGKFAESLECFDRILRSPPSPLAHVDIWFQIGHVYEQQKDYVHAKDAYERVVAEAPTHAKVLQQLGWLYHQPGASFQNQDLAVQYLTKSLEADPTDAQSWYLLGRAYMAGQKYSKAYEAYQQAVYRDGRNPTFWCSIGVLYFQINQFRDALDAYSRAIRINPYISEVWFDLGSLYESCNNQISDAMDAYERAAELDPSNPHITQRLQLLKNAQATGSQLPAAPVPKDVHPTAYAGTNVNNGAANGSTPPVLSGGQRGSLFARSGSRGPGEQVLPNPALVATAPRNSPGPFRGAAPPAVVLDDARRGQHALAPMAARDDYPPRSHPSPHVTHRPRSGYERSHDRPPSRGRSISPPMRRSPAYHGAPVHRGSFGQPPNNRSPPYSYEYSSPSQHDRERERERERYGRRPALPPPVEWDRERERERERERRVTPEREREYRRPRAGSQSSQYWDAPPPRRQPEYRSPPPQEAPPRRYYDPRTEEAPRREREEPRSFSSEQRGPPPAPPPQQAYAEEPKKRERERGRETPVSARSRETPVSAKESSPDVPKKSGSSGGGGSVAARGGRRAKPLKEEPQAGSAWPAPSRTLDEDYDEGVADALMGLASGAPLKRARSPSVETEAKRARVDTEQAGEMTLPPIATLSPTSPTSTTASNGGGEGPPQAEEPRAPSVGSRHTRSPVEAT